MPDPIAYGPTGHRCGCGKDAHSNLAPCQPNDVPVPLVRPTEYTVSLLPEDDINAYLFAITVQYRGEGRWAVTRGEHTCLGRDGTWAQGVKPYDRGDDWLDAHRFDRDTALRLARETAPTVTVNGITALQAHARTNPRKDHA